MALQSQLDRNSTHGILFFHFIEDVKSGIVGKFILAECMQ